MDVPVIGGEHVAEDDPLADEEDAIFAVNAVGALKLTNSVAMRSPSPSNATLNSSAASKQPTMRPCGFLALTKDDQVG